MAFNAFNFSELTDEIRSLMSAEIELDNTKGLVYISDRLTSIGRVAYLPTLRRAVQNGDEVSLQDELEANNYFEAYEFARGKRSKVPSNAAQVLAQNEFNRYYIRAVCVKAIEVGQENVKVYRARQSSMSRPESELKIGRLINAKDLLLDLRNNIGQPVTLLPEISSGLSVERV